MANTDVVLTSFDPFGGLEVNPSSLVVESLATNLPFAVRKIALPTSFERSALVIEDLFDWGPLGVIMFGYTGTTDRLRLEQVARNRAGSEHRDNDGRVAPRRTLAGAPQSYVATANVPYLATKLQRTGIPCARSVDAGTYVCNHAYFLSLHRAHAAHPAIPCVFVHVPKEDLLHKMAVVRAATIVVCEVVQMALTAPHSLD